LIIIAFGALAISAQAQFYPPITFDPSVVKFFDESSAFSATMEVITKSNGKDDRWPVRVAVLKGMTRVDMDITQAEKSSKSQDDGIWRDYVNDMKKAGSAESASILNPRKKSVFTVLPRLKVYLQTPIADKDLDELKNRPKSEKVELGKETIDGFPCVKYKLTFNKDVMDVWRTWESPTAIVWSANALKGCPIRMEILNSIGGTNCTLVFKNVELKEPESRLFEPPKGFTKCDNEKALMEQIMQKWPKDK